jgi:hypothetical protein
MRYVRSILMVGSALALAACGADDIASPGEGTLVTPPPTGGTPTPTPGGGGTPTPTPGQPAASCPAGTVDRGVIANRRNCELSGRISADFTLQNLPGVIYSLSGPVNVGTDIGGDGNAAGGQRVTLTIQPGTVIFASQGNDYLVVNRGSRINAVGTATQPIIFTARANVEGTATDSSQGLWGGIILLGRAPISDCNAQVAGGSVGCQQVIEGTTGSLYGGATADDNSGTMRYVQIRYSGFAIAPGNELQGLTLGGVGSGTDLSFIQVHNSSDDGIEIFGGRARLKNLVVTGADDDSIDTDLGWQGGIQFAIAVHRDENNGDSMMEIDSNGNEDALPRQFGRIANFTFIQRGRAQGDNAILVRGGADYTFANGVIVGPDFCVDIDETAGTTTRAADATLQDQGPPVFRSVALACPTAFRDDNNVTVATIQALFAADPNNRTSFTPTLQNTFVNGANEAAVPAFNVTTLNTAGLTNFFVTANYIGAVRDAQDRWYEGWTCNAAYVSFGTTGANCTALPTS